MACFRPLTAFQEFPGAPLRFLKTGDVRYQFDLPGRELKIPCGRCVGCRQVRVRSWALRCMHEAQMHRDNCYITLTYGDKDCPPSLNYSDFQDFMRRLRKRCGPTRFFMCGEYGEENWRPHFHALLFGRDFRDRKVFGKDLFRSPTLESLWPFGYSSIGEVTYQSAAYVARYSLKGIGDYVAKHGYPDYLDKASGELVPLRPQFGRMSLKPGIGYNWFQKYWSEVFLARNGEVIRPGGMKCPAPRYYMTLLENLDEDLSDYVSFQKYLNAGKFADDCTESRLRDRELCALAREQLRRKDL